MIFHCFFSPILIFVPKLVNHFVAQVGAFPCYWNSLTFSLLSLSKADILRSYVCAIALWITAHSDPFLMIFLLFVCFYVLIGDILDIVYFFPDLSTNKPCKTNCQCHLSAYINALVIEGIP